MFVLIHFQIQAGSLVEKYRDEDIEESERLKQLPQAEQMAIVALIDSPADDMKLPEAERTEARRRSRALAQLLKLPPSRKRKA
jgi:hypothetical protein